MRHSGQRIAVFTVVLITAALAATVAFGQIPDSDGVIHACYHTGNGGIRVVNDGTECSAGEDQETGNLGRKPRSPGRRLRSSRQGLARADLATLDACRLWTESRRTPRPRLRGPGGDRQRLRSDRGPHVEPGSS